SILARIPITVPHRTEQTAIAEHVASQTRHIKAIAERVLQSMSTLREYRTALISAAVTGKIDVRGEVFDEPG
ncbi:MAG: restriction endonuclease subunit S, partial [Bacillota bacterium]